MDIQVKTSKLDTGKNISMTKDEASEYAKTELESAVDVFDIEPMTATIELKTEGSENDPVQKCDIKLVARGQVIKQSSHSRSIKKAIDRAMPELRRQLRKYKTKKIDKRRQDSRRDKFEQRRTLDSESDDLDGYGYKQYD